MLCQQHRDVGSDSTGDCPACAFQEDLDERLRMRSDQIKRSLFLMTGVLIGMYLGASSYTFRCALTFGIGYYFASSEQLSSTLWLRLPRNRWPHWTRRRRIEGAGAVLGSTVALLLGWGDLFWVFCYAGICWWVWNRLFPMARDET